MRSRRFAACALALTCALASTSCSGPAGEGGTAAVVDQATFGDVREPSFETPVEPVEEPEPVPYAARGEDLLALSGQQEPFAFASVDGDEAPALSQSKLDALASATEAVTGLDASAGYVLFDLETGRGIAANVDARVFSASSIKAPYALFLCETQLDASGLDPDEEDEVRSLVEAAVSESDNDAYHALRDRFAGPAFGAWLDEQGIGEDFSREQYTPYYTARESALLWLRMFDCLGSDAPSAPWLNGLLENTRVSFMRHAIADGAVDVVSKAGWLDGEGDEDGFCDSGIVTEDGHAYLLTVMTSLPYSPEVEYSFEALVQAVWNARGDIAA